MAEPPAKSRWSSTVASTLWDCPETICMISASETARSVNTYRGSVHHTSTTLAAIPCEVLDLYDPDKFLLASIQAAYFHGLDLGLDFVLHPIPSEHWDNAFQQVLRRALSVEPSEVGLISCPMLSLGLKRQSVTPSFARDTADLQRASMCA